MRKPEGTSDQLENVIAIGMQDSKDTAPQSVPGPVTRTEVYSESILAVTHQPELDSHSTESPKGDGLASLDMSSDCVLSRMNDKGEIEIIIDPMLDEQGVPTNDNIVDISSPT